jgi:D-galacturonate reductase
VPGLAKIQTSGEFLSLQINLYADVFVSYYLSSHHIDICCWILQDKAVPTRVVASAATGIATGEPYNCVPQTEDTITLLVDWQSINSPGHKGTAVYTASWTAPLKAGIHSAQHWYYMGAKVSRSHDCLVTT